MEPGPPNRVLTVPNVLSALRLALIPVFIYLLLVAHADGWAVAILMFSGASDWADGKIARLLNQSSRLGESARPGGRPALHGDGADRVRAARHRAVVDRRHAAGARRAAGRRRCRCCAAAGFTALPVTYVGKAATFALMSGFPADPAGPVGRAVEPRHPGLRLGVSDLGHGHVPVVVRAVRDAGGDGAAPDAQGRRVRSRPRRRWLTMADQTLLGGYDPDAGRSAHEADAAAADPGAVAAARAAVRASRSRLCRGGRQTRTAPTQPRSGRARVRLGLAGAGGAAGGDGVRRRRRPGPARSRPG